jgi:DNA invertase Pin-like site-specific DNA recombinase
MTVTTLKKRALLYARAVHAEHPAAQLQALRLAAEQRGWTTIAEYLDAGRGPRRQWDQLLAHVRRGAVEVVAVAKLTAFASSIRQVVLVAHDLALRGIDLIALDDSLDTSGPHGPATNKTVAALVQLDADLRREATRRGLQDAKRRNPALRIGRPPVQIDLDEAHRLIREGCSLRHAARLLKCGASTLSRALRGSLERMPYGAVVEETFLKVGT